jgi:DNA-binding MarR family transcriptional regulator
MPSSSPSKVGAPPTRWLSDAEQAAWRAYVETVGDLTSALEADLAPTGLNLGDYQVLVYLSEAPDQRLRMCDLAGSLQLSPSGLTRRLDGLVRGGLVERQGSPHDRRVMLAVLTDRGLRALTEAAPVHAASVRRRIFDHLDAAQVEAMTAIWCAIGAAHDAPDT